MYKRQVQACIAQGTAVFGSFIAMQLDVVQAETVGIHQDVFLTFVDKMCIRDRD